MELETHRKIILDLCGGTGSWSEPYQRNGYDVRVVTIPEQDVRTYKVPHNIFGIHGVLAAPPCDHFSNSGAQYWEEKDRDGRTLEAIGIVIACLRIIAEAQPKFWCLENPRGRISRWLGESAFSFNPCDYGDPYTKETHLWGRFNVPHKKPVKAIRDCDQGSWMQRLSGQGKHTKELRAKTPAGFANAFYKANK